MSVDVYKDYKKLSEMKQMLPFVIWHRIYAYIHYLIQMQINFWV